MKNWYILFSMYENTTATTKRMIKSCLPKGCGTYVPIIMRNEAYHINKVTTKPIYPFYIFVCCDDEKKLKTIIKRMEALQMSGYFLTTSKGKYATVSSDEIRAMEKLAKDSLDKELPDMGFYPGDIVDVVSGPMSGISGPVCNIGVDFANILYTISSGKVIELPVFYSDLKKKEITNGKRTSI